MSNAEQQSAAAEATSRARLIAVRVLEAPSESTEQRHLRKALNACCGGVTKAGELLFEVALQRTASFFGEDERMLRLEGLLDFARRCVEPDNSVDRRAWRAEVDEVLAASEWDWNAEEVTRVAEDADVITCTRGVLQSFLEYVRVEGRQAIERGATAQQFAERIEAQIVDAIAGFKRAEEECRG